MESMTNNLCIAYNTIPIISAEPLNEHFREIELVFITTFHYTKTKYKPQIYRNASVKCKIKVKWTVDSKLKGEKQKHKSINTLIIQKEILIVPNRAFPSSFNPGIALKISVFWR